MDYLSYFNSLLDNGWLNQVCLLCPPCLDLGTKFEILDEIAFRLQIEFQKEVKLMFSNPFHTVRSELDAIYKEYPLTDRISEFDVEKTVVLANIQFPYFSHEDSWEKKAIQLLEYYRLPVLGFTTHEQYIKIYEK